MRKLFARLDNLFDNSFAQSLLCLIVASVVFIWATITPPFQSPDEIAHFYRTQSIPLEPWAAKDELVRVHHSIENPLFLDEGLRKLPFKPMNQLFVEDVINLRNFAWPEKLKEQSDFTLYESTASKYPPLYYASLLVLAEPLRDLLDPPPYESFYIYRYASVTLGLICWAFVVVRLKGILSRPSLAYGIVALVLLIPMNSFISASINPDVILNPLSALFFIEIYRGVVQEDRKSQFLSASLAIAILLTKPSAIFVIIALGLVFFFVMLLTRKFKAGLITAAMTLVGSAIGYFSFYPYVKNVNFGTGQDLSFLEYLKDFLDRRCGYLMEQFWGTFGWLDFKLTSETIISLEWITIISLVSAILFGISRLQIALGIFAFSAFIAALLLMEYYLITNSPIGIILQGRYVTPLTIGFAFIYYHKFFLVRWSFLVLLFLANLDGFTESRWRYYSNDSLKIMAALPFTNSSVENLKNRVIPERRVSINQKQRWKFRDSHKGSVEELRQNDNLIEIQGWILLPDTEQSPGILIEMPVTPKEITAHRVERADIKRKFGSGFGFSGFVLKMNFSSKEKADIARANFCLAANDKKERYPIQVSGKNGSCRSAWRP